MARGLALLWTSSFEDSPTYGQVNRIVNNCNEETVFTEAPFDNFLDAVERYIDDQGTAA